MLKMRKFSYLVLTTLLLNSCNNCKCIEKCNDENAEILNLYLKSTNTGEEAIDEINYFKDSINIMLLIDSLSNPVEWYSHPNVETDNKYFPVSSKIELYISRENTQKFDQFFIIQYSINEQDTIKVTAWYKDDKCAIERGQLKDEKKYSYYGVTSGIYLANQ